MKTAPYARSLSMFPTTDVRLYIGGPGAWQRAQSDVIHQWPSIALPDMADPCGFDWRGVQGLGVLVIELTPTSQKYRHNLTCTLAAHQPQAVYLMAAEGFNSDLFYLAPDLRAARATRINDATHPARQVAA